MKLYINTKGKMVELRKVLIMVDNKVVGNTYLGGLKTSVPLQHGQYCVWSDEVQTNE